jgi:hypothetical protein
MAESARTWPGRSKVCFREILFVELLGRQNIKVIAILYIDGAAVGRLKDAVQPLEV